MTARLRAAAPSWRARHSHLLALFRWTSERAQELAANASGIKTPELLEVCPEDSSHVMPREALNRHIWRCRLIKRGLRPDRFALLRSTALAYANATGVVSFLSGHGDHAVQGFSSAERRIAQPTLALVSAIEGDEFHLMGADSTRRARGIGEHRQWTSSWEAIPFSQRTLSVSDLDVALISEWIISNAARLGVQHILRDAEDAAFVVAILHASPDVLSVAAELKPILGDKTRSFVLALWAEIASLMAAKLLPPSLPLQTISESPYAVDAKARHEQTQALNRKRYQEAEAAQKAAGVGERAQAYDALVSQASAVRGARSFEHVTADQITDLSLGIVQKKRPQEEKKSELEMMQEQRDYKRRRQRYRARNTHLTKRRPAEVARDMIRDRMRELFPELEYETGEVVEHQ